MRIAFSTISCPAYSLAQVADAAQRYGYDGVELYALDGARLTTDVLAERVGEVRRELAATPIACLNSWARLSDPDPAARAEQEALVVHALELAAELACPLVKSFGGELPDSRPPTEVFDYMGETIERIVARGRALGVRLVVETHDGFCAGRRLAELLARVDDDYFGALWDVHHPHRVGESVSETDDVIGARVLHAHVKDAVRDSDGWRYALLGEGELPVAAMLERLRARGFGGYVSVDWEKMWHPEIAGPSVALPQFATTLRTYG